MDYFFRCLPPTITSQQKGARAARGRVIHYVKKEVKVVHDALVGMFREQAPAKPLDSCLCLHIRVFFPYQKGTSKKILEQGTLIRRSTHPDWDNLAKGYQDALADAGFFTNDSRVADGRLEKFWSPVPGIAVTLTEIDPMTGQTPTGFCPHCWRATSRAIKWKAGEMCDRCGYTENPEPAEPEPPEIEEIQDIDPADIFDI